MHLDPVIIFISGDRLKIVWHKRVRIQKHLRVIKRILAMSRQELMHRVTQISKNQFLRLKLYLRNSSLSDHAFLKKIYVKPTSLMTVRTGLSKVDYNVANLPQVLYKENTRRPRFFFDSSNIVSLIASFKADTNNQTIEKANEILRHSFHLFGLNKTFGSKINWHLDPTTDREWPKIFRGAIRYGSNHLTRDVKYVWELNRHKHFVTLARAYILSGEEKYAAEFVNQINDWIDHNPVEMGVNWLSNLEVAIRIISWLWAYHIFRTSTSLAHSTHFRILKSIYEHARHIYSELSIYTDPANHLIGEATALWLIGLLFPEFEESQKWKDIAFDILERELHKQIHPDGVNVEQAIGYHRFVLDFYTQVVLLAQKNNISIPDDVLRKMEKMFEFIMELVDPNGRVPMIGDADDARGIPVTNGVFWDFRDSLSTGAVLFNRPDMKALAGEFHETSLWLLGLSGKEKFGALPAVKPKYVSTAFPQGGYCIMKAEGESGPMRMVFDCGPMGYPPNADHGHADTLSFTLNISGVEILVDPGTFGYACAGENRDYFRGTRAHNTVLVDSLDQADPFGTFKWLNPPNASINRWISTEKYDLIEASHNGYTRLKNPVTHRRMIFFVKPEYWIIIDLLDGSGHHQYEQYFHFSSGSVTMDPVTKMVTMRTDNKINFLLAPAQPEKISASILEGSEAPFEGWISHSYGTKAPATVLKHSRESEAPTTFKTVLLPFSGKTHPLSCIETMDIQQHNNSFPAAALKLKISGNRDYFVFSASKSNIKVCNNFESDADLFFLRKDENNSTRKLFLLNGSFLLENGHLLIHVENEKEYVEA